MNLRGNLQQFWKRTPSRLARMLITLIEKERLHKDDILWPRPHHAGGIWKRSFIATVRPTVHTNPSRKHSFISTVRPTVHTNPSRKRSFISTVRPTVHTNPSRKRSVISTVRPTVHTNPSRKRSFISTVSFTVHTNPSRKGSFSKPLFKPEETPAWRFRVDGKHLKTEFFDNGMVQTENIWCIFRVKTPLTNFYGVVWMRF